MSTTDRQLTSGRHIIEFYMIYRQCCNKAYFITSHDTQISVEIQHPNPVTHYFDAGAYWEYTTFYPGQIKRAAINRVASEQYDKTSITVNLVEPFNTFASQEINKGFQMKIGAIYTREIKEEYTRDDYDILFWGEAIDYTRSDNIIEINFASWQKKFDSSVPTFVFMRSCNNTLYDFRTCKVLKADYTYEATITEISDDRKSVEVDFIDPVAIATNADYFENGEINFGDDDCPVPEAISGATTDGSPRSFRLLGQVPNGVDVDDSCYVSCGCDHTFNTCLIKYNNSLRYGGLPFLKTRNPALDRLT